jgi:hypothetical protein
MGSQSPEPCAIPPRCGPPAPDVGDAANARALFERVLSEEANRRCAPLWERYLAFEFEMGGDLQVGVWGPTEGGFGSPWGEAAHEPYLHACEGYLALRVQGWRTCNRGSWGEARA